MLALLLALFVLDPDAAGDAGALSLTLDDARARGEARSAEAQLARGRKREAEATRVGAGLVVAVNPRLSIDGRRGLDAASRDQHGYAASLDLMLDAPGAPGARVREADQRVRVASAEVDLACADAGLRAAELYVEARLAALRSLQGREAIALAQRLAEAARERQAAGAGSDIEVTSAEVELAERRTELISSEDDRLRTEHELRFHLEVAADRPLRLTSDLERPAPAPALGALLARALAGRPDLAVIESRVALLDVSAERLRKEARPKVGTFAAVDASPASPMFGVWGLSFELPFFQRNQGPRAVVAAERQSELDRLEITRKRIGLAVRTAHDGYLARLAELDELGRVGVPAAQRRLALVEEGWRAGRFDVFRVTSAAQDLVRLRTRHLDVLGQLWRERLVLERLTGGFDERK